MLSSESVSGLSIQLIDKDEYNKEVAEKMSRVTVITGGTSGIGRGIVEKILANSEQDDLIFATYAHNAYKANDFWDSLKPEDQEKLIIMKADMSSYDDMMNFVKEVKEKAGHVDWLISNAGISTYDKFQDYTFEEWNNIVNTNLSIPVFMIKEFMPVMTEGGRVLFMGSYAGQQAYSSSLVYGVTKAAIHFLTKSLVKEFEPKGIPVYPISAISGKGLKELLYHVSELLSKADQEPVVFEQEFFPEYMLPVSDEPYSVTYDEDANEYVVEGPRIEKMLGYTNLDSEKGFTFFQNFLKDNGILDELEALGISEGDTVRMYGLSFDYYK